VDVDRLASDPKKIISLADPKVAALIQPLIDASIRLGKKIEG